MLRGGLNTTRPPVTVLEEHQNILPEHAVAIVGSPGGWICWGRPAEDSVGKPAEGPHGCKSQVGSGAWAKRG